ncbi:lysylphosphatidylglycerol synthase transmembrane domain-containing protein [Pseudonocardia acaciae]|uniref:lysylphosphatidylglycerol synthase transmembrane domain-containing protein n=1 Tax=Pseudonocardia acaciae TaxID=551276 RepID=UPI0005663DCF|nr:lysylphosphatidylglycerol synthase transmembrane domain-containing protein [Pseudonocardia acaciae]
MTRRLWPWTRLLIALGIVVALVWRLGTGSFLAGLRAIDAGVVLAALGIGLLTTVFSAARWCLVAHRLGLKLALPTAVADYYRALLLNAVLPAGVLGDAHRAVSHGQDAGDVGRGIRAVALERLAGQAVLITVGAAVLFTQPEVLTALMPGRGALLVALVLVVAVIVVAAMARQKGSRWRRALTATLVDVRRGLLARRSWPGVAMLSAAALLGHLVLFVLAARAAGAAAPLAQLLPPLVLALLAMGLPLNVGGWGPREAVCAAAFGAAGLDIAQGLTVAVVYGVLTLVASLPGITVLLFRRRARASAPEDLQVCAERLDQAGQQRPALAGGGK